MKKIIPILTLLLVLVGCGKNNPEKTTEKYLDSLKNLEYQETKSYYANENEFFVLKDFTDRLSDGFRIIQSDKVDEKTMSETFEAVKSYNDKAYEKSMDFDYEILETEKIGDDAKVKVKLIYQDGKDYPQIVEKITRPEINSENFVEDFNKYYKDLEKELDKYNEKKKQ